MTTPVLPTACPTCAGPLLADHPAGLVLQHRITCPLLAAEDATAAADHRRLDQAWSIQRPATTTERRLLATGPHDALTVTVHHVTRGVRRRDFDTTPTTEEDQP